MEMTDELRQRAYSFSYGGLKVGDDRVLPHIRAAFIQNDGTLCRTLNGSIMPPGTALFIGPDNEPTAKTIEALLAVIDAQALKLRKLAMIARYDIWNDGFTRSGEPNTERSPNGEWVRSGYVLEALKDPPVTPGDGF
jgi:hypothetical protein